MTGKVFSESANIYQDQAKVLFDYYKAAAEKIVAEEKAINQNKENMLRKLENDQLSLENAGKKANMIIIAGAVLCLVGIGIIVLIYGFYFKKTEPQRLEKEIEEDRRKIQELEEQFKNIRRDYSVDKIGVVYVPVATKVPFENKSLTIDHTNSVGDTDFHLTVLNQPEEFNESIQNLKESMNSAPVVEGNEMAEEVNTSDYSTSIQNITLHDYVGNIDRQVRNVSYLLNDNENISVSIPAVKPESKQANFIKEYGTTETGNYPVTNVFNVNFDQQLDRLNTLNSFKNQLGGDNSASMKQLMTQLAESVQVLSKSKNSSASKLMNYTSSIFANVLKAGYTQYSPALEAEEIEKIRLAEFDYQDSVNTYTPFRMKKSSVVKFDIFSNNWVAEDGSRTSMPFGMNQIDEEILTPIISSLLEENRIERLKIYNNIEDQKREYLDKWSSEVGNYYRDNRAAADELISHMRETYADYMSSYNMYKSLLNTTKSMKSSNSLEDTEVQEIDSEAEMIAGFEEQTRQVNQQQEEFAMFMDRIQDNINDITKDFAHIEYYEGSLRDAVSHDTAVAMYGVHDLDLRRKELVKVSPYVATYAELPPTPNVNEKLFNDVQINLENQVDESIKNLDDALNNKKDQ